MSKKKGDRAQTILHKANKRRFDAAGHHKTLSNWVTDSLNDFNEELRTDLPSLRTRSRDAAINDVYARAFFDALKTNVVGPQGIKLKMDITNAEGGSDVVANKLIEDSWAKYETEVTTDGLTMREALNLFLETVAKDGEVFVVMRRGEQFGPHMIQLQFFDAEFADLDWHATAKNGNSIRSSIEYDQFGKPVAYWLFKHQPHAIHKIGVTAKQERIRFEAKDVIHGYCRERVSQGRGFPWLSSALVNLTHIREYQKSELVAARVASAKMGFFTRQRGEDDALGDSEDENDANAFIQEAEPGMFDILPEGYGLETFDPQNPNANFPTFVKSILKGIASSVGVAYHTLSNDLESTSYSSLRQGAIEERDTYRGHQQWLCDLLMCRVFEEWLTIGLAFNVIPELPLDNFDKFNNPAWKTRTWLWIDPQKETNAIKVQIEEKLRSRTDIARQLGNEYNEVLREIADENAMAEQLGIDLNSDATVAAIDDQMAQAIQQIAENGEEEQ